MQNPLSRRLLIAGCALLMLAAVAFVLWGGGESSVPQGAGMRPAGEDVAGGMLGDLGEGEEAGRAVPIGSGQRSVVFGEGEFDPDVQRALCGFRGRIVDFRDQPVDDCGVRIFRMAMDSLIRPGVSLMSDVQMEPDYLAGEDQTDGEGRFQITGVWPRGLYLLYGGIGTDNPTHVIVRQTPGPGEMVDLGDIVLNNGAVLTGVVVDEDSEPVPGALVRAVDLPGQLLGMVPIERFDPEGAVLIREESPVQVVAMPSWVAKVIEDLPIPRTTTDAEGRFRLVGLVPGANLMAVTRPGYLSEVNPRILLKAGEEKDMGRIRLREGEQLFGQVVDGSGEPVAGAEVVAAPTTIVAPIDFGSFVGPSDQEGRFQANGFPRGQVTVAARRGPGQHWILAEPQSIDSDVVIQIPGAHDLTVGLVSSLGADIESPSFRLLPGSDEEVTTSMGMMGFVKEVDLSDRLEQLEDGRYKISDLSEGPYTLLATSPGHAVAALDLTLEGDEEVTLELGPVLSYSVRVTDIEGEPIRSVQIYAVGRGRGATTEIPLHCGYTNADGRLTIDQVSGDQIRLTAKHPAYGMTHARGSLGEGEIAIVMAPPGAVVGELTESGQPPEPGKWTVIAVERGGRITGALEDVPQFAMANLEGIFEFKDLQPGGYRLQAVQSLDLINSPGSIYTFAMTVMMEGEVPPEDVEVVAGTTTRAHIETNPSVVLDGPSARITGIVMVNGRPAEGVSVQVFGGGRNRKAATVDETGLFDLAYVPEGTTQLMVLDMESADMLSGGLQPLWTESLEVVANEDQHLQIDLQTSSLSGTVVSPDGEPIPLAAVRLTGAVQRDPGASEPETSSVNFHTQTDLQGRFEFKKIPEGQYSAQVQASEGTLRTTRSGITVLGGLPVSDLRLVANRTYSVRGQVDLSVFGEERPQRMTISFSPGSAESPVRQTGAFIVQVPDGFSGLSSVQADGSFEVRNLPPGSYRVQLFPRNGEALEHEGLVQVGSADLEGIVIRPVRKDGR